MLSAMKTCCVCARHLEENCFYKDRSRKDGLDPRCKVCHKNRSQQYAAAHKEQLRLYKKEWYAANKIEVSAKHRAWKEANVERVREREQRRYQQQREKILTKSRLWYEANRERKQKKARAWKRANALKLLEYSRRRRALEQGAPGGAFDHKRRDYRERIQLYAGMCAYCTEAAAETLDHGIPLSRGGGNWAANIYPACLKCNMKKGTRRLYMEWQPPRRYRVCVLP